MAIDPIIQKKANDIRTKVYGIEVREDLASGLEVISRQVVDNSEKQRVLEGKQNNVETQFQEVIDETTGKDVISAPELIAARDGEKSLSSRLYRDKSKADGIFKNLSFSPATNIIKKAFESAEPAYLDNIGDGYLYGSNSRNLYRKNSLESDWELVKSFANQDAINGIRPLGDGEVLILRSTDGLWKSSGWSTNPLTASWKQVLVTNGRVTPFSVETNPQNGWVTATTYINGDMTNARYVWLSKDNGNTFKVIFDIMNYDSDINQAHAHFHFAVMDAYHNETTPRIWISYHKTADDPTNNIAPVKRVKYSDNAGVSWADFSNADYQPVAAIATPAGVIFGSDESIVGVYIVRRKENPSNMKYELFYAFRENIEGIFGWAMKAIKGEDGAYHMAFRSSVGGFPAFVITTDGVRIAETLRIEPSSSSANVTIVDIVEFKGKLLATYYDSATSSIARGLISDKPERGIPEENDNGALRGGLAGPLGVSGGIGSKSDMLGTSFGANSLSALRGVSVGEMALSGAEGVAVGSTSLASGNGVAFGKNAKTDNGVSVGRSSVSISDGTSIGPSSKTIAENVAIGSFADAQKPQSVAIGRLAKVDKDYGVAIGALSSATGTGSVAIGRNSKAAHDFAVALGYGVNTTAGNQFKVGNKHIEFDNFINPSTRPVNGSRLFSRLNSNGKTELCVLFPTGSPVVIATEA